MLRIEVSYLDTNKKENFYPEKAKIAIGRSSKADVVISREELSRSHMEIERENDNIYITDLNSTNGIFVNGEQIPKGTKIPHQIVFPIEIAKTISILLFLEEQDVSPNSYKTKIENKAQEPNSANSDVKKTRTRVKNKPEFKTKEKSHELKFKLVLLLVIGMIAGVWTIYQDKTPVNQTNEIATVDPQKATQALLTQFDFKKLLNENHCQNFGNFCSELDPNPNSLVLHKHPEALIIFYDITQKKISNLHPNFAKLPEKTKKLIYLAELGTKYPLLSFAKKQNSKKFIVIGFSRLDSNIYLRYLLNINYEALLKIQQNLTLIHHDYYFSGMNRLFNKYIKPKINVSEF